MDLLVLFFGRFSDLSPKWSEKAANLVIMDDKYSQTPYSDFWADSGTHFVVRKTAKTIERPGVPKPYLFLQKKAKVDLVWQLWPIRLRLNACILIICLACVHPNLVKT